MQRLFSTFPNGWPGCGLLVLRVTCAASLVITGTATLGAWPIEAATWLRFASGITAMLIFGGLWTPLGASLLAVFHVVLAVEGDALLHLVSALNGMSLVMIGPGAWSIDARLYGRKRIDLGDA
jgi:putative oxidoreductase